MTHSDRIRADLSALLDRLPVGSRVPTEAELCRRYSVSRMTVNRVVSEFAREGRLVREPGRGSFVAERSSRRHTITFLLPCANFLVLGSSYPLRQTAASIAEIGRRHHLSLEFLVVTKDNQANHIDFSALDHLDSRDQVVVFSCWYNGLFPFLRERQCRTLLIDRQMRSRFPNYEYTGDFSIVDQDIDGAICQAIHQLCDAGCQRIALRTVLPSHYSPQVNAYVEEMHRLGLPDMIQYFTNDSSSMVSPVAPLSPQEINQLTDFHCDGLIYDAFDCLGITGDSLHDITGLPEEIRVVAFRFNPQYNLLNNHPDCLWMNYEQLGIQGINMLLDTDGPRDLKMDFSYLPHCEQINHMRRV